MKLDSTQVARWKKKIIKELILYSLHLPSKKLDVHFYFYNIINAILFFSRHSFNICVSFLKKFLFILKRNNNFFFVADSENFYVLFPLYYLQYTYIYFMKCSLIELIRRLTFTDKKQNKTKRKKKNCFNSKSRKSVNPVAF